MKLFVVLLLLLPLTLRAQIASDLVKRTTPPAQRTTSAVFPQGSAFASVNGIAFDRFDPPVGSDVRLEKFPFRSDATVTLRLRRFSVMTPDGIIVAGTAHGDSLFTPDRSLFFKGSVDEIPGSYVYLALFRNYFSGYIEVPDEHGDRHRYTFAPLKLEDDAPSVMVIYDEIEALRLNGLQAHWTCGAEEVEGYHEEEARSMAEFRAGLKREESSRTLQSNTLLSAQLALEGDSAYYVAHSRNLSRAANYALTVFGSVSSIYERDINVRILVPYLRIWTGSDPYPGTSTNTLLGQFRSYWNANMSSVYRSVAQLLSNSSVGGGIAYLNTLCASRTSGSGYSVAGLNNNVTYPTITYVWDSDVTSHELGHNFGSPHTHSCTWSPAIDSCYTAEGGCYSGTNPRRGWIMSYCHLTSFGTQLFFHPRVATLLRQRSESASCVDPIDGNSADIVVSSILEPAVGAAIPSSNSITPTAVFRNGGTGTLTNQGVNCTIRDSAGTQIYTDSKTIALLQPGQSATVAFNTTSITTVNRYLMTVSTALTGDVSLENNTLVRPFEVVSSATETLTLTTPNAPAKYRSGQNLTLGWNSSGVTTLLFEFSPDNGANWYTIRDNQAASPASLSWTVPGFATTQGRVRATNRNNSAINDWNDSLFTITTLPITYQWARSGGSGSSESVGGVAVDDAGYVYVIATFSDSLNLGDTTLRAAGSSDVALVCYNPGGTLQWGRSFGGNGADRGNGIAVDPSNNDILITGSFSVTASFGSQGLNSSGGQDLFVARVTRAGTVTWARGGGGSGADEGLAIAVDGNGRCAVAGSFQNSATFSGTGLSGTGVEALALVYNSAGTLQWARSGGGNATDIADGVAIDASGNVVICGKYGAAATFAGNALPYNAGDEGFTVKYNSGGTLQWITTVNGVGNQESRGVATDASGNVYVTGAIEQTASFGTFIAASTGGRDMFLIRYRSNGTVDWLRRGGSTADDQGNSIVVDAQGNIYVGGTFNNTMEVWSIDAVTAGSSDAFLAKFDADGRPQWVERGGGGAADDGAALTVSANGDHAYMAGTFAYNGGGDPPSIFGPDSLRGRGATDLFVGRLATFRVTSPARGDIWRLGDSATIQWTIPTGVNRVRIEYSTNNGASWATLISSTPNDGEHRIPALAVETRYAIVRVIDADNPSLFGEAWSGTFQIEALAAPTDLIATGSDKRVDVVWTPSSATGITSYALYRARPGQPLAFVAAVSPSTPFYTDLQVQNCNDYSYAVKARVNTAESPFSNLDTARPEAVRTFDVTTPIADEIVPAGSIKTLNWTYTGCITRVRIDYSTDGGTNWDTVSTSTANSGSFDWTVPTIPSTRAIVQVRDRDSVNVIAYSDTFTICTAGLVTLSSQGPTAICDGDSVVISASPGMARYVWSTGDTTQSIVVHRDGVFRVMAYDALGCQAVSRDSVVITYRQAIPKPTIEIVGNDTSFCEGGEVTLRASNGFDFYRWSTGDSTREITVRQSGIYTVSVSDSSGCGVGRTEVSVTVHPLPNKPTITRIPGTDSLIATPDVIGRYTWFLQDTALNGSNGTAILAMKDGWYRVTIIDTNGCTRESDSIYITGLISSVDVVTGVSGMKLHPNPNNGRCSIEFEIPTSGVGLLLIHDLSGREMLRETTPVSPGIFRRSLDLTALPAGVYLIEFRIGERVWQGRTVVE